MAAQERATIVLDADEDEVSLPGPPSSPLPRAEAETAPAFQLGAVVRLTGLQGATYLNGEVGTVLQAIPGSDRFEVILRKGGQMKAVRLANIEPLGVLEEAFLWARELSRLEVRASEARPTLRRLEKLRVTVDILKKTGVAKVVKDAAKRLAANEDVAETARHLVKRWRDMFYQEQSALLQDKGSTSSPLSNGSSSTKEAPCQPSGKVDPSRCMARIWDGGLGSQCSKPHASPSVDICGIHLTLQEKDGQLPHGRIDGEIPVAKRGEFAQGFVQKPQIEQQATSGRTPPARGSVAEFEPLSRADDAAALVNAMKNAPSDRVRMGTLSALDRTTRTHLPSFVVAGGLAVLDKWIRTVPGCRFASLLVLQKIPMSVSEFRESRISLAVSHVANMDTKDETRQKAQSILDGWRAGGLLSAATPHAGSSEQPKRPRSAESAASKEAAAAVAQAKEAAATPEAAPEAKRQRTTEQANGTEDAPSAPSPVVPPPASPLAEPPEWLRQAEVAGSKDESSGHQAQAQSESAATGAAARAAPQAWPPTPPSRPAEAPQVSPLSMQDMPPELVGLDARIAHVLVSRPIIYEFLAKHRGVMSQMNPENIRYLTRNLKRSKETLDAAKPEAQQGGVAGRTITLSNLHPEVTEDDVVALLDRCGLDPLEVKLPLESRRRRSCCTAFALLPSIEAARDAARRLQNIKVRGRTIIVESADGNIAVRKPAHSSDTPEETKLPRISWQSNEELWEVALFDRSESVGEFRGRMKTAEALPAATAMKPSEFSARFQARARSEREEEGKVVREALSGQPA
eukprot:TRINITY_DN48788_c0_g1_i1.p1 TRINITY_DN48788_c0_g1~~TRINITY_DN48788_c0_g1_i1.p1  ORF type:complete len:800 (+),score=147.02 TRINITY_DN48788_c0_g1_i1:215-2614(+)